MLRRIIYFALPLLFGVSTPALADIEHIGGYAQTGRLNAEGWEGVWFNVMTPFFPLDEALISVTLKIRVSEGEIPDNVVCSLRQDFRHVPADIHAVPGENGGLGLNIEQLASYTHIHFMVIWENKPGQRAYPHSATIQATGHDWDKSSERTFNYLSMEEQGTPVEIVITGPEECRML
jgi:hypothetical protein